MRKRRKLLWVLFSSHLAITVAALLAVGWFVAHDLRGAYLEETESELFAQARLFAELVRQKFQRKAPGEIDRLCKENGKNLSSRLTVILPSGEVVGDSDDDPARMENHAERPEVRAALASGRGRDVRLSPTVHQEMMYVALALAEGDEIRAVVRASRPIASISQTLRANYVKIALAALLAALFAAAGSWLASRSLSRSLAVLEEGAFRFARGKLEYRLAPEGPEEFSSLAEGMNQMAAELEERLQTITAQHNELNAILAAMIEAVMVVDTEEKFVRVNQAAGRLLGLKPETAAGQRVEEAARNLPLFRFIRRTLESEFPRQEEIVFYQEGQEVICEAHGTQLRDRRGEITHILIVLHDVTRLKRLEQIRRDFVANVSHELKTPLTTIKGFIDTLREGALEEPAVASRFLEIIARHTDRLNAIIEDLLQLSRLEQSEQRGAIELQPGRLCEVLAAAVSGIESLAREKNIPLSCECPENLTATINSSLLQQAVANLLDNAVKFSEPGKSVRLSARQTEAGVIIQVQDHGPGIPPEHLERIFERFYRVDKARSRALGGTGLGLSIVHHIVQLHHGRVTVESRVGEGSIFTIHLP